MTDDSTSGADDVSPWSGEVPIPHAPVEFAWATHDEAPSALQAGDSQPGPLPPPNGADDGVTSSRNRNTILASLGAVLLLVVGWLAFARNGSTADIAADDSVPSATEVADSLPTVDGPEDTEPDDADGSDDSSDDGDVTKVGTSSADGPEWREDTVELPQVLLDSSVPFDLVAMSSAGDYLEVEVPSGRVSLVEVGRGIDGRVIAGETATLFVSYSSTLGGRLLRAGEPILELSMPSNVDISQVGSKGDEFAGFSYGNNGERSLVRVMADGGVVTTSDEDIERNYWQRSFAPDGSLVVSEAGGVYLGIDDGFERISTGLLISTSTNHILVRECDAAMECGYVTIDFESGERVEALLNDDNLRSFGFDSAQVSPDGRWLRYVAFENESSDEVLIDLTTGESTVLDFANIGYDASVWSADSSGFFRRSLSDGFEFFVVATGESVVFGEQFGRVSSFDIRGADGRTAPSLRTPTTTGLSLIALTGTGDVAQIDVDSGAVITTDGPGVDSSAPVTVFPDAAGATFTSYDNVPSLRFIAAERSVLEIDGSGPGGPNWPGPEPGTVWQTLGNSNAEALSLELVDALGAPLGPSIEFESVGLNGVVGSDGRGGVVISPKLGGVFALGASNTPERITSGELIAINATVAYVRECDDALQCGVFAVDRGTGQRSVVDNTGFSRAGDIANRGVPSGQNVSPDGTIAFVRDGSDPTRCLMIDTTASRGAWTGVPCVDMASPILWTADSGYAVWLDEGAVTIYERSTRSVRVLNAVELKAIAVVPPDSALRVDPVAAPDVAAPSETVVDPAAESAGDPAVAPADELTS